MSKEYCKFFVSRQLRWPDGQEYVEIVQGGLDHANPDMLEPEWHQLGEGREFVGMTPAVEAAERVAKAWLEYGPPKEGEEFLGVACGATHGFTAEFDVEDASDPVVWERLRERAEAFDAKLPRCGQCSHFLDEEWSLLDCDPDLKFCSERCAERYEQILFDEEERWRVGI